VARADLIIVGAGLAGSAAAWAASARGMDVTVLEAFQPGHQRGSSHGSARIFRRAYHDPLYVTMTGRAGAAWQRLQDAAGEQLLQLTGGLDAGPGRDPVALHAVLATCGVSASLLHPGDVAERWPAYAFGEDGPENKGPVMYHADAGVLDPDRAIEAMLRLAGQRGADIRYATPAEHITVGGDSATVHTHAGPLTAPVVVAAPGAWIAPLLAGVIDLPPLAVTQEQVFHFAPKGLSATGLLPIFISEDERGVFYGLPGGRDGEVPGAVKLGEMGRGTPTTARARDFMVDPAARQRAIDFTARSLPGLDPGPVNETTCLFTSTASGDFILDRPRETFVFRVSLTATVALTAGGGRPG
jgi:sarcosine oxidase